MSSTSFLSEEDNQQASVMEMVNPPEEAVHNELLAKSLKEMLIKSTRELKTVCRTEKKRKASEGDSEMSSEKIFSSIQRPEDPSMPDQKKGRKVKNEVVAEKVICFSLPKNFDVSSISANDLQKVKERLGNWRIQRRIRETKSMDMYYCHLSSRRTFRSIPEAVSFIMYDSHPRFSKPTPNKKHKVESKTSLESLPNEPEKRLENLEGFSPSQSTSFVEFLNETLEKEDNNDDCSFLSMLEEHQDLEVSSSRQNDLRFSEALKEIEEVLFNDSNPSNNNNDDLHPLFSDAMMEDNGQENNVDGLSNYNYHEADDTIDHMVGYCQDTTDHMMGYCQETILQSANDQEGMMMVDITTKDLELLMEMINNDHPHNVGEAQVDQEALMQEVGGQKDKGLMEQPRSESVQRGANNVEEEQNGGQYYPDFDDLSIQWNEDDIKILTDIFLFDNDNNTKK